MGLFDKMFGYFGYEKASAFVLPSSISDTSGVGRPTQQNYKSYLKEYTDAAWVFTCIQRIASQGAGVPIQLFKKSTRGDKVESTEVMTHPIITLLDKVNPFLTGTDLVEITLSYEELTGNAYWLLDAFEQGHPTEIYPLRPDRVKVLPDKTQYIKGYTYEIGEGKSVKFKPEQIIHFKYFNSIDDYYGLSPLSAGRMAVTTQRLGDEYNQQFYANSAQPRGALFSSKGIKTDNKKRIAAAWKQMHQGNKNAHKVAILEGGLDWKALGLSQKDMDFINQKKMTREDIMGVFGVPPAMVGVFEYANYANSREQREIFWRNTMVPKLNKYAATVNEFLVKPWDPTLEIAFDYSVIDALQADAQARATTDEVLTRSGIKTINEAREERGLAPVDWGNTWRAPLNTAPVDETPSVEDEEERSVEDKPKVDPLSFTDQEDRFKGWLSKAAQLQKDEADKYLREKTVAEVIHQGEVIDLKSERAQSIMENAKVIRLPEAELSKKNKEARDKKWEIYKDLADDWEKKYLPFLTKQFNIQLQETLINLEDHGLKHTGAVRKHKKDADDDAVNRILFNKKEADKALRKGGKPLTEGALEANALKEITALGLGISFELSNPAVQEFITSKVFKFANEVNTTTQTALRKELLAALKAGEGIPQIEKRIRKVFDIARSSRSLTIARTEVVGATNAGAQFAYEQSGVVEFKEWIDSRDSKVRGDHQIDGERVKLNERFSNGLRFPGDPTGAIGNIANCRCTQTGVVE